MVSDLGPRKYKINQWQKSCGLGALGMLTEHTRP